MERVRWMFVSMVSLVVSLLATPAQAIGSEGYKRAPGR